MIAYISATLFLASLGLWKARRQISNIVEMIKTRGVSESVNIFMDMAKQYVTYKLFHYLVESNRNHYIINYPYTVGWYKIMIKKHRTPLLWRSIHSIQDVNNNEILEKIKPYLGPFHNFHGIKITPKDLGYTYLKFNYMNGDTKEFGGNNVIELDSNDETNDHYTSSVCS